MQSLVEEAEIGKTGNCSRRMKSETLLNHWDEKLENKISLTDGANKNNVNATGLKAVSVMLKTTSISTKSNITSRTALKSGFDRV